MKLYTKTGLRHIETCIEEALLEVYLSREIIAFEFNGKIILLDKDSKKDLVLRDFYTSFDIGWRVIGPEYDEEYSDELKKAIEEAKEEKRIKREKEDEEYRIKQDAKKDSFFKEIEGEEIDLIQSIDEYKQKNKDPYGARCVSYAEEWARLMQVRMKDKPLAEVYDKASHDADYDGITGFMYGMAVNILSKCWRHGEELRKLHNKEYGHHGEGVVNPAIINIK